jgi:hypothetical protein
MASTYSNPLVDYNPPIFTPPNRWDLLTANGIPCPGRVEIDGFGLKNNWDIKKLKGGLGATATAIQAPPAEGKFHFHLWSGFHFQRWGQKFRAIFLFDPTKRDSKPVAIGHPSLADLSITAVIVKEIFPAKHIGENEFVITVDAIQYRPDPGKNATTTPKGPPNGNVLDAALRPPPSPQTPLELKIAALRKQFLGQ